MLPTLLVGSSRTRALVGLFCCLVGSFVTPPRSPALNPRSGQEAQHNLQEGESADVFESVVRYQIKSWELAANSYCISIVGKDATTDFLKRLTPLPVKAASGCKKHTTEKVMVSVVDKKTGKRSVDFRRRSNSLDFRK
jgi:hypothetical protein